MRISNHFSTTQQNLFTFLSSFPLKTLNPQFLDCFVPSISHSTSDCSSGSSSFISSGSYPLRKRSFICNSSSGPSCFELYEIRKGQPVGSCISGSASKCYYKPYLPIENRFSIKSPGWLSSRCRIQSFSRCRIESSGRPIFRSLTHSLLHSLSPLISWKHDSCYMRRSFTVSSANGRTSISGPVVEKRNNFVWEIVDILRNNGEDLESRLSMMSSRFSVYLITEIFAVLNTQGISGLRFFEWVWSNNHGLRRNASVCSLIICNVGVLDDYETMFALLKAFTSQKICLTYEAFEFLPVWDVTDSSLNESTQRVVDLLNKVGGSCRNSGVCALIEMFCKLGSFEMARYVIKITESKQSYYCLLIREKCKKGRTKDAQSIIREMQEAHCAPNTTAYNYLLGSLWRSKKLDEAFALLNEMKAIGIPPDEITFEILINFVCKLGKMDDAHKLLDQMVSRGLEPRQTTHACIVKTLFDAEKYEAARKHADDSSYRTPRNMMYSLIAKLYQEKGDIMSARDALVEMIEKCLKPNFSIYIKTVKQLRRRGRWNLARDLKRRHSKFVIKSRA